MINDYIVYPVQDIYSTTVNCDEFPTTTWKCDFCGKSGSMKELLSIGPRIAEYPFLNKQTLIKNNKKIYWKDTNQFCDENCLNLWILRQMNEN